MTPTPPTDNNAAVDQRIAELNADRVERAQARITEGRIARQAAHVEAPWPRFGVTRLPDDAGWTVPSASTPGVSHHVTWGHNPDVGAHFLCTCPAGARRGEMGATSHWAPHSPLCRHAALVAKAERADGSVARPTPAANVSALVD